MSDCDATVRDIFVGLERTRDATHLAGCDSCRRLMAVDEGLGAAPPAVPAMGEALRHALDRDHGPVRHRPAAERAIVPLGAIVAVTAAGFWLLDRPLRGSTEGWWASGALLAMAASGVALSLWRGPYGLGAPVLWRRGWLAAAAGMSGLTLALRAGAQGSAAHSEARLAHVGTSAINAIADPHQSAAGPMQSLGACASATAVFAGVVTIAGLWSARRTVPVSSGSLGAVIGATAGLSALAAVGPGCAGGGVHGLVAHGGPALIATVIGLFLGRRALAP